MKKMLKIIGIIVLAIIIGFIALLVLASFIQSAPKEYWKEIKTEGEIESEYNKLGEYEVEKTIYDAPRDERDGKANHFAVYAPKADGKFPLIMMINGTGVPYNKYEAVFEHLASHGYVVIGNDYGTNWDGKHPSETLDFALNTPEVASKIDDTKIAVGGHSQGGMGAFNAITEYGNGEKYRVMFTLSPTNRELARALSWEFNPSMDTAYAYKPSEITVPTLLLAGTGPFDNDTVSPLDKMTATYNELKGDKVMARRRNDTDHGAMLYDVNGYVLAWLDYYLKGKTENGAAFFGDDAEIKTNSRYQDVKNNNKS